MVRKLNVNEKGLQKSKLLVNIGEQRKGWIEKVAQLSGNTVADVVRVIIDQVSVEDPESFIKKMDKVKLKMKLEDLQRRKEALQMEENKLIGELERGQIHIPA